MVNDMVNFKFEEIACFKSLRKCSVLKFTITIFHNNNGSFTAVNKTNNSNNWTKTKPFFLNFVRKT